MLVDLNDPDLLGCNVRAGNPQNRPQPYEETQLAEDPIASVSQNEEELPTTLCVVLPVSSSKVNA